jgi:serine/threonine protein kinase
MDFSRYTLVSQLSGGRYGAIWRAHDPQLARDVALKQLALADPDRRPTIMAAARAATALQHLNVARTYEPVEDEDTIWLVEEWIDGASLAALSSPGVQLAVQQGLGVVHGALEGLADAHRHGVVHGTVSPWTIMVDLAGTAKLIEFGAWLGHPDAAGIGAYASPEAFAGENLAATADVYSAGAVISELLRGQAAADPERAAQVTSDIRPVLDRAMSADPSARQPDAQTLLDELDRAAERVFGAAWWTTEGLGARGRFHGRCQPGFGNGCRRGRSIGRQLERSWIRRLRCGLGQHEPPGRRSSGWGHGSTRGRRGAGRQRKAGVQRTGQEGVDRRAGGRLGARRGDRRSHRGHSRPDGSGQSGRRELAPSGSDPAV